MKVAVGYFTRGGNTKKLAEAISEAAGKVVNFSTAAVVKSTYKQVKKLLSEKQIPFAEEEFACRGSFSFTVLHRGRPDEDDCRAAAAFAKKMIS